MVMVMVAMVGMRIIVLTAATTACLLKRRSQQTLCPGLKQRRHRGKPSKMVSLRSE